MIEQIIIGITGAFAAYLSQTTGRYARYACLFGMVGQPFWFYSSYKAEQWGIFILCFFYAFAWAQGIKNYWLTSEGKRHGTE